MHKILYFFCFYALANHIYAATLDEARTKLTLLFEHATHESQEAVEHFDYTAYLLRERESQLYVSGPKQIMHEEVLLKQEFARIEKDALPFGVNASACISAQNGLFNEVFDLSMLELGNCVIDNAKSAQIVLNKALISINTILEDIMLLESRMEECKVDDSKCIDAVIAEVDFQELDTPRKLQETIDFTDNRVEAYFLKLSLCGSTQASNFQRYGAGLVDKAQKCVDDLIYQHRPTGKSVLDEFD